MESDKSSKSKSASTHLYHIYLVKKVVTSSTLTLLEDLSHNMSFSNFHFMKKLGKGSFGTVWEIRNKTTNEILAVKVIEACKLQFTITRETLREINILNTYKHQNIIRLKIIVLLANDYQYDI